MSNRDRRITHQTETTHFDHNTGEVSSETHTTTVRLPPEPPFVKMYLNDISAILDVKEGPKRLMYELAKRIDYEGYVTLNSAIKKKIRANLPVIKKVDGESTESPLSDGAFRNYLSELCKKNILRRVDTGLYEMNPHLFAKGEWASISKRRGNFELTVRYGADGTREMTGRALGEEVEEESQSRPRLRAVGQ